MWIKTKCWGLSINAYQSELGLFSVLSLKVVKTINHLLMRDSSRIQ